MKYILTLLFIGSLFAQDTLKLKASDILYTGKIEGVLNGRVKFLPDGERYANFVEIAGIEYLSTPDSVIVKDGIGLSSAESGTTIPAADQNGGTQNRQPAVPDVLTDRQTVALESMATSLRIMSTISIIVLGGALLTLIFV